MKTFIEIGSCDFNTLNHFSSLGHWQGFIIDPIKKYLDRIPRRPGISYINAAVSDRNGKAIMWQFKAEITEQDSDFAGMSTLHPIQHNLDNNHYEQIEVETITWSHLILSQNIERVDYLKIDTEGHDFQILKQIDYQSPQRPKLIKVEWKHSPVEAMEQFLIEKGYSVDRQTEDLFAISLI